MIVRRSMYFWISTDILRYSPQKHIWPQLAFSKSFIVGIHLSYFLWCTYPFRKCKKHTTNQGFDMVFPIRYGKLCGLHPSNVIAPPILWLQLLPGFQGNALNAQIFRPLFLGLCGFSRTCQEAETQKGNSSIDFQGAKNVTFREGNIIPVAILPYFSILHRW